MVTVGGPAPSCPQVESAGVAAPAAPSLPISSLHAASLYLLERLRLLENLGLLWLRAFLLSGLRLSCIGVVVRIRVRVGVRVRVRANPNPNPNPNQGVAPLLPRGRDRGS